ncbi:HlyD family efflux transporter periplasmic adaptor subunit [Catenulispora sp. NL8]|uniref:HlyD family efflux transporter periplasmic adaptor subunit n=1 Tax=Catenulispora pinistramenti TaxID=2705254 RepID=A0ABS5KN53_9ACTN|nr:HlyD family efflux transporter periplasmic adaptor subunit [Catenulispora pinistramenti]MBS2547435.1 HlyD family efflux transporter periplasmic adaptor subunit [Catenulispora pinistramenti]
MAQLQNALASAGYPSGSDAHGHFGPGTQEALSAYYRHLGYPPPIIGGSEPAGVMLPANEVVFVPSFPVRVASLNVQLGQTVSGPTLTLESGTLTVSAFLPPAQADLVKPGMKVQLDAEALGDQTAEAKVASIGTIAAGQGPDTNGADASGPAAGSSGIPAVGANVLQQPVKPQQTGIGLPLTITSTEPLPTTWNGQDVRVTLTGAATDGPVLAVPLSALSTGADSVTSVTVVAPDGSQRRVPVSAGTSADGDVQVTPIKPSALREGDTVVVGQAQQ